MPPASGDGSRLSRPLSARFQPGRRAPAGPYRGVIRQMAAPPAPAMMALSPRDFALSRSRKAGRGCDGLRRSASRSGRPARPGLRRPPAKSANRTGFHDDTHNGLGRWLLGGHSEMCFGWRDLSGNPDCRRKRCIIGARPTEESAFRCFAVDHLMPIAPIRE